MSSTDKVVAELSDESKDLNMDLAARSTSKRVFSFASEDGESVTVMFNLVRLIRHEFGADSKPYLYVNLASGAEFRIPFKSSAERSAEYKSLIVKALDSGNTTYEISNNNHNRTTLLFLRHVDYMQTVPSNNHGYKLVLHLTSNRQIVLRFDSIEQLLKEKSKIISLM